MSFKPPLKKLSSIVLKSLVLRFLHHCIKLIKLHFQPHLIILFLKNLNKECKTLIFVDLCFSCWYFLLFQLNTGAPSFVKLSFQVFFYCALILLHQVLLTFSFAQLLLYYSKYNQTVSGWSMRANCDPNNSQRHKRPRFLMSLSNSFLKRDFLYLDHFHPSQSPLFLDVHRSKICGLVQKPF